MALIVLWLFGGLFLLSRWHHRGGWYRHGWRGPRRGWGHHHHHWH